MDASSATGTARAETTDTGVADLEDMILSSASRFSTGAKVLYGRHVCDSCHSRDRSPARVVNAAIIFCGAGAVEAMRHEAIPLPNRGASSQGVQQHTLEREALLRTCTSHAFTSTYTPTERDSTSLYTRTGAAKGEEKLQGRAVRDSPTHFWRRSRSLKRAATASRPLRPS